MRADAGLAFAGLDIADDDDTPSAPEPDAGDAPFSAPLLSADAVKRVTQICWSRWQVLPRMCFSVAKHRFSSRSVVLHCIAWLVLQDAQVPAQAVV